MAAKSTLLVLLIMLSLSAFGQKDTAQTTKKVPLARFAIGNLHQQTTTVDSILLNPTLLAYAGNQLLVNDTIQGFKVVLFEKNTLTSITVTGATMSDVAIAKIRELKPGAIVVLSDVTCRSATTGSIFSLPDKSYTIK